MEKMKLNILISTIGLRKDTKLQRMGIDLDILKPNIKLRNQIKTQIINAFSKEGEIC